MFVVNNIICETLHPNNPIVQLYNAMENMTSEEKMDYTMNYNDYYTNKYNERCSMARQIKV